MCVIATRYIGLEFLCVVSIDVLIDWRVKIMLKAYATFVYCNTVFVCDRKDKFESDTLFNINVT